MTLENQDIINLFKMLDFGGCKVPAIFGDTASLPIAIDVWKYALGDVSREDLRAACLVFLRSPDAAFWPTPGKLLACIPSRQMAAIDDADGAWGLLIHHAGRVGSYTPPKSWDSPDPGWRLSGNEMQCRAMEAGLQAIGGWKAVCATTDETIPAARASFRGAYRAVIQRQVMTGEHQAVSRLLESRGGGMRSICEDLRPLAAREVKA